MADNETAGTVDDRDLMRLAARHWEAGRLESAARLCARVLEQRPDHAEARHILGMVAWREGRLQMAADQLLAALRAEPRATVYHANLGAVLADMDRPGDALRAYTTALRLQPDSAHLHFGAGNQLLAMGENGGALAAFDEALRLDPEHAGATANRAAALLRLGRLDEAVAAARDAALLDPAAGAPLRTLAGVHAARGELAEAIECLQEVLRRNARYGEAHLELAGLLLRLGRHDEAVTHAARFLDMRPSDAALASRALLVLARDPARDGARWRRLHALWHELHAAPRLDGREPDRAHDGDPERALRIGCPVPDPRIPDVERRVLPLLRALAARGHTVHVYAPSAPVAEEDDGLIRHAIEGRDEAAVAQALRTDGIDVVIDAFGHDAVRFGAGTVPVLARRPAPLAVGWGYPGTLAAPGVLDALVTDTVTVPEGEVGGITEPVEYLGPGATLWSGGGAVARREAQAGPVYLCWAPHAAIGDAVLAAWAALLERVPAARLLLVNADWNTVEAVEALQTRAAAAGVPEGRLECRAGAREAALADADVVLDSFPASKGAALGLALGAGLPAVTLSGDWAPGRTGASALTTAGLSDWVATDAEDYVAIAAGLGQADPAEADTRRRALAERMAGSALGDPTAIAAAFDERLRDLWRRYCER